jgi:hypothetical protein
VGRYYGQGKGGFVGLVPDREGHAYGRGSERSMRGSGIETYGTRLEWTGCTTAGSCGNAHHAFACIPADMQDKTASTLIRSDSSRLIHIHTHDLTDTRTIHQLPKTVPILIALTGSTLPTPCSHRLRSRSAYVPIR